MSSKTTCIAWTNWAFVRAVAGFTAFVAYLNGAIVRSVASFAAFVAYRGVHSRAVVSVVALRFERAFAIGALVFWTRETQSAFVSRAATFVASMHSRALGSVVALRFERAFAVGALVFRTREALSAFVSGAATIAASCLRTFACRVS